MGQASRTTKVLLAVGKRKEGGANTEKRAALDATAAVLNAARADLTLTSFSHMRRSWQKRHALCPSALGDQRRDWQSALLSLQSCELGSKREAEGWRWMHYPVNSSHYIVERLKETDWQRQSPTLVLRAHAAELHIPQVRKIAARKQWQAGKPVKGEHSNQQLWSPSAATGRGGEAWGGQSR